MASPLEAGATLLDLQTELYARGYDHLAQDAQGVARGLRWINAAYFEATLEELWPFRLVTATGASPLSITDLDQIKYVMNTDYYNEILQEMSEEELADYDLSQTGIPAYYYRDSLQVKTWPVNAANLSVRYFKLPVELSAPTDTTLVPKRYMDVITNGAVRRAAVDRDNPDAVALAESERQRMLTMMRSQLLVPPTHMRIHGGSFDE